MKSEKFENGEKGNYNLLVRITATQHNRIKALAEASGYKTISQFVRSQLLNPSIELKVNQILALLQEKKQK